MILNKYNNKINHFFYNVIGTTHYCISVQNIKSQQFTDSQTI